MTANDHPWRRHIPIDLIVCSSSPRWNAALKVAICDATARRPEFVFRLHEVEELAQVSQQLESFPRSVVGIEVGEENLRICLQWLAKTPLLHTPVIGLLSLPPEPMDVYEARKHRQRAETLQTVVREAGAAWAVSSPQETGQMLEIAARRAQCSQPQHPSYQALSSDLWHLLPWHSPRPPLRLT